MRRRRDTSATNNTTTTATWLNIWFWLSFVISLLLKPCKALRFSVFFGFSERRRNIFSTMLEIWEKKVPSRTNTTRKRLRTSFFLHKHAWKNGEGRRRKPHESRIFLDSLVCSLKHKDAFQSKNEIFSFIVGLGRACKVKMKNVFCFFHAAVKSQRKTFIISFSTQSLRSLLLLMSEIAELIAQKLKRL